MRFRKQFMKSGRLAPALAALLALSAPAAEKRPNIIVIITDDHGYADVGFNGSTDIPTPALDRLAHAGAVLTDAYVTHPYCGPSRAGLMAGRHQHQFGVKFNPAFDPSNPNLGLPLTETPLPLVLQANGYRTGGIGKWHLGAAERFHPLNRGFDFYYGFTGGGHDYYPDTYEQKLHTRANQKKQRQESISYVLPLERNRQPVKETEYLTDVLSREAIRFIQADSEKPFFLYLAYNAPHAPMQAKPEDLEKMTHIINPKRRTYAAMVYAVDRGVAEITNVLKQRDELDNTLIFFLSDNGGKLKNGADNGPLHGEKGYTYEGGIRVPFFVHWPAEVKPQTFPGVSSSLDIYATSLAAAGLQDKAPKKIEGTDLIPYLNGTETGNPHDRIFAQRIYGDTGLKAAGLRQGNLKLFQYGEDQPWQLFDLSKDIGEDHDLAAQKPEELDALIRRYKTWTQTHEQIRWEDGPQYWEKTTSAFMESLRAE